MYGKVTFIALLAFIYIANASVVPIRNDKTIANPIDQSVLNAQPIGCKCMNWRSCHSEINSDVTCPQSYLQICCIQPDPHPVPESKPDVIHII